MSETQFDQKAWFDRIGYAGPTAPTLETLNRLIFAHAHAISYETLAHVPSYSKWLSAQDWTPAYARHRRNLALIGANEPAKRWVLKNPSHLFALDALLAVYPDAIVVQTHRPMRTTLASSCSLSMLATRGYSERFVGATIGRDQLDLLGRGADLTLAGRARHDASHFYDVNYGDLVADPVGTVEAIYRHFELPLTVEAEHRMRSHLRGNPQHKHGRHAYDLKAFGLDGASLDQHFGSYREFFGIEPEFA